jgi:hypothetical protein
MDYYGRKGIKTSCTDSAEIALFSKQPLTAKSAKQSWPGGSQYYTSFGAVEAQKLLGVKKIIR